jgi:hypothetical protein
MKISQFTDSQIMTILKENEAGPVYLICAAASTASVPPAYINGEPNLTA